MNVAHDIYAETNPAYGTYALRMFVQGFIAANDAGPELPAAYLALPVAMSGDLAASFDGTNRTPACSNGSIAARRFSWVSPTGSTGRWRSSPPPSASAASRRSWRWSTVLDYRRGRKSSRKVRSPPYPTTPRTGSNGPNA